MLRFLTLALLLLVAGTGATAKAHANTSGLPPRVNMEVLGYYENWAAGWVRSVKWGILLMASSGSPPPLSCVLNPRWLLDWLPLSRHRWPIGLAHIAISHTFHTDLASQSAPFYDSANTHVKQFDNMQMWEGVG